MKTLIDLFAGESTEEIAKQLLGMYLQHETTGGILGGYIVDCEAYLGPEDLAAHSFGMRQTPRVQAMYQKPGTIYLYTMHTHLILNFITQPEGMPQGIMIRGIEPIDGLERMIENRGKSGRELSNGPGKLVKALGIPKAYYGRSIFDGPLRLVPEQSRKPKKILELPRIGIPNKGDWTHRLLRFAVAGNPYMTQIKKAEIQPDHGWEMESRELS